MKLRILTSLLVIGLFVYSFIRLFLPAMAQQTISVTGIVPPQASDFDSSVMQDITAASPQYTTVTYTITYSSHLSYTDQLIVEAQWYSGTVSGNAYPTVDGLSYVDAANAYNGTTPVVDLSHNKIDWTISSFPANTTNKTVSFRLQTNDNYGGSSLVTYPIKVRLIAPHFTTTDTSVMTSYQYDLSLAPTPAPQQNTTSSAPTATPTPAQPTSAPTTPSTRNPVPSTAPIPVAPNASPPVQNVSIVNLSQDSGQVAFTVQKSKQVIVRYGTSPNALTQTTTPDISSGTGLIDLQSLDPSTTYYLQIVSTDPQNKTTASNVFSLQTAQVSDTPQVAKTSIVVSTDSDILYSSNLTNSSGKPSDILNKIPQIPVAQNTNYNLTFKLTKTNAIKSVAMILKNISVLAASTVPQTNEALQFSYPVVGNNGIYSVQLQNPPVLGVYDAYIRIADFDGNITTQKIAQIRSLKPFRIYDAKNGHPIEDARIVIFRYNSLTKKYEIIPTLNGFENPLYTNKKGEASEQLTKGQYSINTGRIGFKGQDNVRFSIGTTPKDDFPTIYLQPTPVTPLSLFTYYRNAFIDYIGVNNSYIAAMQASSRFFDLFSLAVFLCFVCILLLLFKFKTHIAFSHLPYYLHHHSLLLSGKESPYIHGNVIDSVVHQPIDSAIVFLLDETTHRIIGKTTTNRAGGFLLPTKEPRSYAIFAMKEGFEPSEQVGYNPHIIIALQKGETIQKRITEIVGETLENSFALYFEFMLVFTLLLEIILFPSFGLFKTIPFLALSILNILLWAFYVREKGKQLSVN